NRDVELPAKPAVISASASLFGEWSANIISYDPPPTDPNLRDALAETDRAGGDAWPGATLPDIGQLTAQASRIAGDVGVVTQRISARSWAPPRPTRPVSCACCSRPTRS